MTPTQVVVGGHLPITGPVAPGFAEIGPAADAYFHYINDQGGVYGRRIVYKYIDDQSNPSNAVNAMHQLLGQPGGLFAAFNSFGIPTHQAALPVLSAAKVPDVFPGPGCLCWNQPTTIPTLFGFAPPPAVEAVVEGRFVVTHLIGKVGYFLDNTEYGGDAVKGLDIAIPRGQVVSRQVYDESTTNVRPQMEALQRAGAQIVVSFALPQFTALELVAAAQIGYRPTFVLGNAGSDIVTLTRLIQSISKGAAGGSLLEGAVTDIFLAPIDEPANPWTQLFRKVHDTYAPKLPIDQNVEYGMAAAYTFVRALQEAGQNPTRDSLVRAMQAAEFTGPGLVPFASSPVSHGGYAGVQVGRISIGRFEAVGSPDTVNASGKLLPYTTPAAAPPPPQSGP